MRNQIRNHGQITPVAANMIWSVKRKHQAEYRYVITCS